MLVLALCGKGESSEKPDERGESAEDDIKGESGGVGSVVAKSVVSMSVFASELVSGTFMGVPALAICGLSRSSSADLTLGWLSGARNSEDLVFGDRDSWGLCHCLGRACARAVFAPNAGEVGFVVTCDEAGLAKSGDSIGAGLCAGRDVGVIGIAKSFPGKSIVVTGASTLTLVGA